jgi:hypothetical protein
MNTADHEQKLKLRRTGGGVSHKGAGMNGYRTMSRLAVVSEPRLVGVRPAGGVVLLVMLGLLSIFTLVSVTFVVSSGHARRGAGAASRAEQMGDPFEVLLNQAMMQVARGSNHPQSAIGPHGLLEDIYGNSGVVAGAVYFEGKSPGASIYGNAPLSSQRSQPNAFGADANEKYQAPMLIEIGAVSFGWDREPGSALIDDNGNMVIDDVAEVESLSGDDCFLGMTRAHPATVGIPATDWQSAWKNRSTPIIDNVENYYAGRVITFVNGDCAGQSSYIVRSKIASDQDTPTEFRTILFINPFPNGSQPRHNDRFVINGRAFSGTGFGYSPYNAQTGAAKTANADGPNLRALDFPYSPLLLKMPTEYGFDELANADDPDPIATLPNPTDSGVRDYINRYSPIVSMNEDYDAADEQNMLLSYTAATAGGYRTIIPSLHRPDLVRYHTAEHAGPNARWLDVPPYVRRRYILRPDPSDHYDYTQESTGAGGPNDGDGWTPGEPYTDTNLNRQWDPGEPYTDLDNPTKNGVYDIGDRSFYNPSFDAMDGPWDLDNDGDGQPDTIWVDLGMPVTTTSDGKFVKPMFGILVRDLDGRINVNAHGSPKHYTHIHNGVYMAEGPFDFMTKPAPQLYNTEERVRMGIYNVAMMQLVTAPGGTAMVSTSTGAGTDVVKTHSVGHADVGGLHGMSPQDVKFEANKLFALAYNADKPGNNNLIPFAAYMFDLSGFRSFDGSADYDRMVDGFEPAVGQGYSAADVNIAQVLQNSIWGLPGLPSPVQTLGPFPRFNPIRRIIEGQGDGGGDVPPREGRYGEVHLLRPTGKVYTGTGAPTPYGYFPGLGVVPRAGVTDMVKPRRDYYSPWKSPATSPPENTPVYNATAAVVLDMSGMAGMAPAVSNNPMTPGFYSSARPPYDGDDDNPRLPVKDAYGQNPTAHSKFQFGSGARNRFMQSPTDAVGLRFGDYGTPGDFDSDGFVALDIMGNPVYEKMGTEFEDVDAPTEINLNRRYNAQTYFGASGNSRTDANRPITAAIDSPYTPAELERLLRYRDVNSASLPPRLWSNLYGDGWVSGDAERSVTTEQWDVPCPHIAPTPELSAALNMLGLPLANPSIGDLLRARFYLASGGAVSADQTALLASIAMRSYRLNSSESPVNGQLPAQARKRGHTRLLSPDLGMGLRMDINAPFGNGFDDDGNTVVDEPNEPPGSDGRFDPLQGLLPGSLINFDGNRDGNYIYGLDEEPRQQYAKELYCLMMLLVDQNYVEPLATAVNSAGDGQGAEAANFPTITDSSLAAKTFPAITDSVMKTRRFLFARKIAQWAINTVDFRDRDAIMSPFEFDADPFYDNDGDLSASLNVRRPAGNGTWDVDGYIIKKTLTGAPDTSGDPDIRMPWRGLVWGCEYPDLILTETLAFHDRRAQNLFGLTTTSGTGASGLLFSTTNSLTPSNGAVTPTHDLTWDQRRVPQGSAFIEMFATGNRHNPALPRELYTLNTYQDPVVSLTVGAVTNTELRLDLGRIAGDPNGTGPSSAATPYPVWRLVITESHTRGVGSASTLSPAEQIRLSIAERIQEWPNTCSLELSDPGMSLLSPLAFSNVSSSQVPVEKVIHFSSSTSTQLNVGAKAGLTQTAIEVYSNQYKGAVDSAYLSPGDYAVIGPYRAANSGPRNITMIGRTETRMVTLTSNNTTVTVMDYDQPPAIIDMGEWTASPRRPFLVTSVNGADEYPRTGVPTAATLMISATTGLVRAPITGTAGALDYPTITTANPQQQIRVPVAIPVACTSNPPSARLVGLNISEPNTAYIPSQYYPLPNAPRTDTWLPGLVTQDLYSPVRDVPLDDDNDGAAPVSPSNRNKSLPPDIVDQTVLNFKTVFLQRLANPLMPWNLYENPYLTVDWMPLDLTIFNGEPHFIPATAPHGYTVDNFKEPRNEVRFVAPAGPPTTAPSIPQAAIRFGSRQRGAPRYPVRGLYSLFDLWSQPNWLDASPEFDTRPPPTGRVSDSTATIPGTQRAVATGAPRYSDYYRVQPVKFQDPLNHSLGFLNQGYHTLREQPIPQIADPKQLQLIPVQEPVRRNSAAAATVSRSGWYTLQDVTKNNHKYVGAPRRPFNWLTWNNRPFAGSMELMLVPSTSMARLMHEYSMRRVITPSAPDTTQSTTVYNGRLAPFDPRRAANHYMPKIPAAGNTNWVASNGTTTAGRLSFGYSVTAPFAHLLNFFESSNATMAGTQPPVAANYFRLFEFVNVPSRFSGTKRMHLQTGNLDGSPPEGRNNAALPGSGGGSAPNGTVDEHFGWPFTAPFNYIPLYREPGRININTIIPLGSHALGAGNHNAGYNRTHRGERVSDDGAGIWRSVLNDFHPMMRWLPLVDGANNSVGFRNQAPFGLRAHQMTNATTFSQQKYFFNPSEDTVDNFYSAFASTISDNPLFDPRGPDGIYGTGDDSFRQPFWPQTNGSGQSRHDYNRPALFANPFRSFMSNYSDVVNSPDPNRQKYRSTFPLGNPNPLLAADATLMRRRDTTWNPYDNTWLPGQTDAANSTTGFDTASTAGPTSKLFSPAQIDPRFDPMFTLNYPRPFRQPGLSGPAWWQHSGYSSPLIDARPGVTTNYGATTVDTMRVRDTDFRNTDRNPFFRYQMYTKLSNSVTTRSNVYAIWITIGFFECEKVQPSASFKVQTGHDGNNEFRTKHRYPDGYRIIREVGSDTGETQRHRAFAILDRTIPVGFMRGENLNVDRAFIIRHILD